MVKSKKLNKNKNNNGATSEKNEKPVPKLIESHLQSAGKQKELSKSYKKSVLHEPIDSIGMYKLECAREGCIPISHYIKNINNESFELCYANVGPEDFLPLSLSLGRNTTITRLDLSHNWLGDEVGYFISNLIFFSKGFNHLSQSMGENPSFTEIILVDNKISSKMAEQFFDAASALPNLKYLNLSENRLGDAAAPFIADLMLVGNKFAKESC